MNNQGLEALAALASKAQLSEEPAAEGRQPAASESTTNNLAAAAGARTAPAPATTTTSLAAEIQQSLPTALQYSLGGSSAAAAAASTAQLQQALAASGLGIPAGMPAAASNIAFLAGMQQQLPQTDNSGLLAMQQLAYYQYLMGQQQQQANDNNAAAAAAAALQQQQQRANNSATCTKVGEIDANQAAALAALTGQTALAKQLDASQVGALRQVLPNGQQEVVAGSPPLLPSGGGGGAGGAGPATAMPPPQVAAAPASSQPIAVSTQGVQPPTSAAAAAASKPASIAPQPTVTEKAFLDDQNAYYEAHLKDKKHQKRAANRRSAQLSRKRKKQFIEELKEENDDLRRKEQILMSIPDLIVVFDSSGKLWFVSQSVSRFLQFSSTELEGTSFWDCLCEDSVRLLKAAFMDSLAARQPGSDSAPLGSGFWELRLVDKDRTQIVVTLNGVVHFTGDRPECVCSIRPRDQHAADDQTNSATVTVSSQGSSHVAAGGAGGPMIRVRVEPQQSVVSNSSSSSDSDKKPAKQSAAGAVRISDRGSSSGESESGSSDELVATS